MLENSDSSWQIWLHIDFGDVEELCALFEQAKKVSYKERTVVNNNLEHRVRVDIEGDILFVSARSITGSEFEAQHKLKFSPFDNPAYDEYSKIAKVPKSVSFMTEPDHFCFYLRAGGSKAQIMLDTYYIKWESVSVGQAIIYSWPVSSKRRPV